MKNPVTKKIIHSALIAAVYAALTIFLAPISYGSVQFRISEALCVLAFFMPSAVWGLTIGCALANLMSTAGILDIILGSAATMLACICMYKLGGAYRRDTTIMPGWTRLLSVCLMPAIFNGPIIGAMLAWIFPLDGGFWVSFVVFGAQVAIGELAVLIILGLPLLRYLIKTDLIKRLSSKS